jgi:hypothetical protein
MRQGLSHTVNEASAENSVRSRLKDCGVGQFVDRIIVTPRRPRPEALVVFNAKMPDGTALPASIAAMSVVYQKNGRPYSATLPSLAQDVARAYERQFATQLSAIEGAHALLVRDPGAPEKTVLHVYVGADGRTLAAALPRKFEGVPVSYDAW